MWQTSPMSESADSASFSNDVSAAGATETGDSPVGFVPLRNDEERLRQLVDWLEEHVSAYGFVRAGIPIGVSLEEVQRLRIETNAMGARLPDEIIHASMMVLGAAVNHTSPYLAYADGTVTVTEDSVSPLDVPWAYPGDIPEGAAAALVPDASVTNVDSSSAIPVRVFTPTDPTGAVVVAAHGGGFWMGNGAVRDNSFAPNMAALAARSGAIVVDVDYRLAPEYHPEAAAADIACVVAAVSSNVLQLPGLVNDSFSSDNPIVVFGQSSGAHCALRAVMSEGLLSIPLALLLLTPPLDLSQLPPVYLEAIFGPGAKPDSAVVSPGIHPLSRPLRVHVQSSTHDEIVPPADSFLAAVTAAGGIASQSSFLATHQIATPAEQRRRITDAAQFILEVTDTQRELPADPLGEYDKEEIDRRNEATWGRS